MKLLITLLTKKLGGKQLMLLITIVLGTFLAPELIPSLVETINQQ